MKAFDILEAIRKEFAKKGTGSWPIVYIANGTSYKYDDVKVDEDEKRIIVNLKPV